MRLLMPFLLVLVIGAGLGYLYWTTTPQYAIGQIKDAIKNHDLKTFQEYADVDAISSNLVDDFLTEPMQRTLGQSIIGEFLIVGLVTVFKPQMTASMKQQLLDYVKDGNLRGLAEGDQGGRHLDLKTMDSRFGFQKHAFQGIQSIVIKKENALLGLRFYNATYNQDLILEVVMNKADDNHWHLVQLSNVPQFLGRLAALEAGRAASGSADPTFKSRMPSH